MNWIDEFVAVGGWKDVFFVDDLKEADIDLIIDARTLFYPIYGSEKTPLVNKVMKAGDMLVALTELEAKVLVRCHEGIDRTPFVAMVYVSKKYNKSYKDAYAFVKKKRPQTVFHWEWVKLLDKR
jgi:protein-tyrosine phosphatase